MTRVNMVYSVHAQCVPAKTGLMSLTLLNCTPDNRELNLTGGA